MDAGAVDVVAPQAPQGQEPAHPQSPPHDPDVASPADDPARGPQCVESPPVEGPAQEPQDDNSEEGPEDEDPGDVALRLGLDALRDRGDDLADQYEQDALDDSLCVREEQALQERNDRLQVRLEAAAEWGDDQQDLESAARSALDTAGEAGVQAIRSQEPEAEPLALAGRLDPEA